MVKKTILCAQYRLPYPIYWSGADISNLTFLNQLFMRGFKVETLFVTSNQEPLEALKILLEKRGYDVFLSKNKLTYKWNNLNINIVDESVYFSVYKKIVEEKILIIFGIIILFLNVMIMALSLIFLLRLSTLYVFDHNVL